MITVDICLNPYGSDENVKTIAKVVIVNMDDVEPNRYDYVIIEQPSRFNPAGIKTAGSVVHLPDNQIMALISAVVEAYFLKYDEERTVIADEYIGLYEMLKKDNHL